MLSYLCKSHFILSPISPSYPHGFNHLKMGISSRTSVFFPKIPWKSPFFTEIPWKSPFFPKIPWKSHGKSHSSMGEKSSRAPEQPRHAKLTSAPPPKAGPFSAATVVLGEASIISCRVRSFRHEKWWIPGTSMEFPQKMMVSWGLTGTSLDFSPSKMEI